MKISILLLFSLFCISFMIVNAASIHNEEEKYMPPGKIVPVEGHKMHVFLTHPTEIAGNEPTIVFLGGLGTASPYIDFLPLIKSLGDNRRIAVVERFGYGWSDGTAKKRTNRAVVEEIRAALAALNVSPPYLLVTHSLAGIFALWWANHYHDEIYGVVGLDTTVPGQEKYLHTSTFNLLTGYFISPAIMRFSLIVLPGIADHELYRKGLLDGIENGIWHAMVRKNVGNWTIFREMLCTAANIKEVSGYTFPENVAVTFVLSSDSEEQSISGNWAEDWKRLHEKVLTNPAVQKIIIMPGSHYIHWNNTRQITECIDDMFAARSKADY